MRKLFFLLASVALLAACEKEPNVAPKVENEAEQMTALDRYLQRVAEEGIAMLGDTPTRAGARRMIDPSRTHAFVKATTRSEEDTLFYVVNFIDSTGFALVDANMESPAPLIAVTEQGNYTPGEVTNSGFDLYMDMLSQNSTRGILPDVEIDSTSTVIHHIERDTSYSMWISRGPLVNVRWGQGVFGSYNNSYPYNKYCKYRPFMNAYAGCATTAIAQVMSHYKQPASFKASWDDGATWQLNWDTILNYTGGHNCEWSNDMVETIATLFREIAKDASVNFGYEHSGVSGYGSVRSGLSAFGYTSSSSKDYDPYLVKMDIATNKVVIAGGHDPNALAHLWVIDGYKTRNLIVNTYIIYTDGRRVLDSTTSTQQMYNHMNWGLDGDNNGYFSSSVFNLSNGFEYDTDVNTQTGNYRIDVKIITNIKYEG